MGGLVTFFANIICLILMKGDKTIVVAIFILVIELFMITGFISTIKEFIECDNEISDIRELKITLIQILVTFTMIIWGVISLILLVL